MDFAPQSPDVNPTGCFLLCIITPHLEVVMSRVLVYELQVSVQVVFIYENRPQEGFSY